MAPIRRYLRISRTTLLELRVYVEEPALAESWLLRPGRPALAAVVAAVRPLIAPKLREEAERAQAGRARRGVRDRVDTPEFAVAVFLTAQRSRPAVLVRQVGQAGPAEPGPEPWPEPEQLESEQPAQPEADVKPGRRVSYGGLRLCPHVLCLIVDRKHGGSGSGSSTGGGSAAAGDMLGDWLSTQAAQPDGEEEQAA